MRRRNPPPQFHVVFDFCHRRMFLHISLKASHTCSSVYCLLFPSTAGFVRGVQGVEARGQVPVPGVQPHRKSVPARVSTKTVYCVAVVVVVGAILGCREFSFGCEEHLCRRGIPQTSGPACCRKMITRLTSARNQIWRRVRRKKSRNRRTLLEQKRGAANIGGVKYIQMKRKHTFFKINISKKIAVTTREKTN